MLTFPFWNIKKIFFHLLLGLLLSVLFGAKIIAQNSPYDSIINIEVNDGTVKDLLTEIEIKGGIKFSYNPNKIPLTKRIAYSANKSIDEILIDISKLLGLEYELLEQQVILRPSKSNINKDQDTFILSGYVKDRGNGEALIGATVSIKQLERGTSSNSFGYYSVKLPVGTYDISYSYIGYDVFTQTISSDSLQKSNIELVERSPVLDEVVIESFAVPQVEEIQMSKSTLQPSTVSEMPALFGEMDVVKSMEFVPGVKAHSDGSSFFYVRGGNRDQNLIIIDDAPIFNSSHMLGVFSTIIPDAINSIDIYKGDMPASIGGRLSSVIDIRTKKGNDKKLQIWGNSSLISSKLGIEGPIVRNESSFLISGRVSRLKWLFKNQIDDLKQLYFYDFTGKVNFKVTDHDQVFVSTYTGSDNYFVENSGIKWANLTGSLRWNHIFNDKIFMNATIAGSSYDYFLHTDLNNNTKWKSHIANLNIKGDFTNFIGPENIFTFGGAINGHNFNPGNLTTDDPNVQPPLVSIKNAFEAVVYANHEVRLSDHWGIKYGLRLTSWSNQGSSFEFKFDENYNVIDTLFFDAGEEYNNYANAEPRLGLSYFIHDNSSIKFSYSRNVQNLHLITNSISPFTSLEVWLPSSLSIKPQIADQIGLGYLQFYPKYGLSFSAEAYYKEMQNQIDYEPHAETLLNPLLEGELRFGKARAYGAEFTLKKEQGRLRGWLGYTYSRATRTFKEINNGKSFRAYYDRPHEVNLVIGYDASLRVTLGMNWIYYTGSPYSSPVSFFKYNGLEAPIYGEKNNSRLPNYHRLDLSVNYKLNKNPNNKFRHDISFSFYNIYGRKNTLFINYNKTESTDGTLKIPSNLLEENRVTSQYYLFRFTSSFTYNFRFL